MAAAAQAKVADLISMPSTISMVTRGKGLERWTGTWLKRMAATMKATGTTATWLISNISTDNILQLTLLLTTMAQLVRILLTILNIIPSDLEKCLRWLH
jgi:hypothetical protein